MKTSKKLLISSLLTLLYFCVFSQTYNAYYVTYGENLFGEIIIKGEAGTKEVFEFTSSEVKHSKLVGNMVLITHSYKIIKRENESNNNIFYECSGGTSEKIYFMIHPL